MLSPFLDFDRKQCGIMWWIEMPDGSYHSFHGVNRNGNAGTLLYVHGNPKGEYREEKKDWPLITNYSVLEPESTAEFLVPGDDRYERAERLLGGGKRDFSVAEAFSILREVRQEGVWATRVSFVYAVGERKVYYVLNNQFDNVMEYQFGD